MSVSTAYIARLFWRAALRRCPNCGGRPIFETWFRMRERCPVCGIQLERGESGYQVGAYMLNIIAAELCFAVLFVVVLLETWPSPPWTLIQWGAPILMILAPIFFYPYSKTLFLAFDLIFRPASREAQEGVTPPPPPRA